MSAGYSGTPLAKKLGYKPGCRALIIDAIPGYLELLRALPEAVTFGDPLPDGTYDLIHLFTKSSSELQGHLVALKPQVAKTGMLWVSWPKKTSKIATDLNGNVVRELGLACGLVDVKVCAVDADWSGLKFVWRVKDR